MKTAATIASLAAVTLGRPQEDGGVASASLSLMSDAMERKVEARARYMDEGLLQVGQGLPTVNRHIPCEGGEVYIEEGEHGAYTCRLTDFYSFINHRNMGSTQGSDGSTPNDNPEGNDIWGTTLTSGEEVLAVGQFDGTAFVRVNADGSTSYLGRLPTATIPTVWRDMKSVGTVMYIGSEAPDHGVQVFEMERLSGLEAVADPINDDRIFEPDFHYTGVGSSHNIVAHEDAGFVYVVGSDQFGQGLYALDVSDPLNPTFAGDFSTDGYVHDAHCITYDGPDTRYTGKEICVCFNEDNIAFVDVTNKERMRLISRTFYKGYAYTHQGWWSINRRSLFVDDEIDELDGTTPLGRPFTRTMIFNTEDLENPFYISDFVSSQESIDHNMYVRPVQVTGGFLQYALQANYTAGLRVLIIRRGGFGLREEAHFDVHPEPTGAEFLGSWSVYPYFASGYMAVNSIERGLFIVRPQMFIPPPADGSIASDADLAGLELNERLFAELENEDFEIEDSNKPGEKITASTEQEFEEIIADLKAEHDDL